MKKLLFLILTLKIFSYEVSEDIYRQLEETKLLLKEKRITKAQQSLNYMLEWFSEEMNPLELDLVKYFQGEIFYLKEQFGLAINNFNIIIKNNNIDQDLLRKVKLKLIKLYLATNKNRMALKVLAQFKEKNRELLAMEFLAYKNSKQYKKAFKTIEKLLNSQILTWRNYLLLAERLNIKEIKIDKLFSLLNKDNWKNFYNLFKNFNWKFIAAKIADYSFNHNFNVSIKILKETIEEYISRYEENLAMRLLEKIIAQKKINDDYFLIKLTEIYINVGEFQDAFKLTKKISKKHICKKYQLQFELFKLSELFIQAEIIREKAQKYKCSFANVN